MTKNLEQMKCLFEPQSVALVGASGNPGKISYNILSNIVASGYKGNVYPINPKGGEILGYKVYGTLEEIPGPVDHAIIVVPAKMVFDSVKECAAKKVQVVQIITSGFSEVGNNEEEKQIVKYAREHDMRILGPNIFGTYSATAPINSTFGPADIMSGGVAILTQSGALGAAMIGKTKAENIGLSSIVSIGNKADIDEADLLEYLMQSDQTKVIFMYIEGVKQGDRLVRTLKEVTKVKPVIVVKSGRSKRGAMAAASHTGSLAGADGVFDAIMRQCGAIRAETVQESLNWCKFLSNTSLPQGPNTVIVTNGGGIGVLAADACEKYDVPLYDDHENLKGIFADKIPSYGSTKNPVDITGGANSAGYEKCLRAAFDNSEVHSVICLGCETAMIDVENLPGMLERIYHDYKDTKPMSFSFFGGDAIEKMVNDLRAKGVPIFNETYDCVSIMGALYKNLHNMNEPAEDYNYVNSIKIDEVKINEIVNKVKADGRTFLLAHESAELMRAAGVSMPVSKVAHTLEEAVDLATSMGFPVVMKVVSKDIIHKSDAGGVALDLENRDEVIDAWEAIMHNCRKYNPNAKITGIEVCEMVKSGTETIIGARQDSSFGPTVMFGLGGIYVEVMKDVSFAALPVSKKEAMTLIKSIKSYPLLLGVRGEAKKDINAVLETIIRVGKVLLCCDKITDIEVNPLVAYEEGDGAKAVDARILLTKD